jgi:hypothetical protein
VVNPDQLGEPRIRSSNDGKRHSWEKLRAHRPVEFRRNQAPNVQIELDDVIHVEKLKYLPRFDRLVRCLLAKMENRAGKRTQEFVLNCENTLTIQDERIGKIGCGIVRAFDKRPLAVGQLSWGA